MYTYRRHVVYATYMRYIAYATYTIAVSVVGVVCAGVDVAVYIVVSDAVGVCTSVVYVGVGGGMQLTNCVNSSCSLKAISAFLCLLKSFLLCYNVLESIC